MPANVFPGSFDGPAASLPAPWSVIQPTLQSEKKKKQLSMRLALKGAFAHKPPSLSPTQSDTHAHTI